MGMIYKGTQGCMYCDGVCTKECIEESNNIITKMNKEREVVESTQEDLLDLWDGVYNEGDSHELYGETYTYIKRINTSHLSDGPSWDYIVQRKSDGKYFKFNVWDAGDHNGYIIEDEYLEEVFLVEENKTTYK
jgi:hypothetical protein